MSVVSLATLKTYFETGDKPTQGEFEDLIDTLGQFVGVLVPFKLELSAANLLAGGFFDITELPAPGAGFAWKIVDSSVKYTHITTAYDALGFYVYTDSASVEQMGTNGLFTPSVDTFASLTTYPSPVDENALAENKKITAYIPGSTVGDGTAIVYGMARLITL